MRETMFRTATTGTGAIAASFAVPTGATYQVVSVTLHLSAAGTTSEQFTVTLNAVAGAAYDVLLYTVDLSAGAIVNLVWQPGEPFYVGGGDSLDVAWPNTEGRTYGLLITMLEV